MFLIKYPVQVVNYVSCWFKKTAEFIKDTSIKCAFIQLIQYLKEYSLVFYEVLISLETKIDFCYRSFVWDNDFKKKANVHVIIIGFSHNNVKTNKLIFDTNLENKLFSKNVNIINEYLIDAPYVLIEAKTNHYQNYYLLIMVQLVMIIIFLYLTKMNQTIFLENPSPKNT